MDTLPSVPPVFLHLLADRKGNLSAFRLDVGPGVPESLITLAEHPDFLRLTGQSTCLFFNSDTERFPPALASALVLAGCRPVSPECIYRADRQLEKHYPAGIEWLDGDWYLLPLAKPMGNQAASRALALQLVQLVAADADNREIEAVFRRDPVLAYHLLRLVNSLGVGVGRRITSFAQAIVILGRQQLRRWLNLMVFSAREGDQRSAMLLARVAVRARAMELLARACGLDNALQDQAFMAGMFSMLGTLFGLPIEDVLRPLTIGDAMRDAVLVRQGEIGHLLGLCEAAERGDFVALGKALDTLQVSFADFNLVGVQACDWMVDVVGDSRGRGHA